MSEVICEVCIDSVSGALAAQAGGADRVELCANLIEGGTTPSIGMIQAVRDEIDLPVMVMIRCRGGDFCYSPEEVDVMVRDIAAAKELGVQGVVFGALTPDGEIDTDVCKQLMSAAEGLQVTFHRAFDVAAKGDKTLESVIALGVDRLLTSGVRASAEAGMAAIRRLAEQAAGRISIMAGCGVSETNIRKIVESTGIHEVHFSASDVFDSPMRLRRPDVPMSSKLPPDDFLRRVTSQSRVELICSRAKERYSPSHQGVAESDLDFSQFSCCGDEDLYPFQCSQCHHPMVFCYECETLYSNLDQLDDRSAPVNHSNPDLPIFDCPNCSHHFEFPFMKNPDYHVSRSQWLAAGLGTLIKSDWGRA